jgi:hypothetical protein
MTTLRQAAQQALEALEGNCTNPVADPEQSAKEDAAIAALRLAIEQAEKQEPVVWAVSMRDSPELDHWLASSPNFSEGYIYKPLYTYPQPAQQPLTDEQILRHIICSPMERAMFLRFARAIERAHGIGGEA